MLSEKILRIARDDLKGRHVLMNVSSNGPLPLDLKLLATEGESPFILNLQQSTAQNFRASSSHLHAKQWEALLQSILLQQPISGNVSSTDSLETLEITANVTEENIVVIFRKNISGITQRLGELSLDKDEEEEIDPVSWAGTAVVRCNEIEKDAKELKTKYEDQGKTLEKLNRQLEDLIIAKNEHENSLLEKFRELLNAKKLKIRDLHRALAAAKVDPQDVMKTQDTPKPSRSKVATATRKRNTRGTRNATIASASHSDDENAAEAQTATKSSKPRAAAAQRAVKRKAKGTPAATNASASDSDEEKTSETMSVDQDNGPPSVTPERSDESGTEDEDDDLGSVPVSRSVRKEPPKASSSSETPAKASRRVPTPPPRRELPFRKSVGEVSSTKNQPALGRQQSAMDVDDEETSDDEL